MTRLTKTRKEKSAPKTSPIDNTGATELEAPVFAQPEPTPDPTKFEVKHPSDNPVYKKIDELNREHKIAPLPFPPPRGLPEPKLTLAQVLDLNPQTLQQKVDSSGQLVFHAVGDTGNTRGPESQNLVSDKMVNDFTDAEKERPLFFLHLGDVIYSFGEAQYYYDQFYEPYRDYPAPILALAGNHDGMVAPGANATTLEAFLDNFCAEKFEVTAEAGGLARTAQIQPGVFFTFEAPLVRIVTLYSNTLEDPGVIENATIGDSQLTYLKAALNRVKSDKFKGALILAHHHPAYTAGGKHGWSQEMLSEIDKICTETGVWPHAVLSAHAHNYQRFTRLHGETQIPYLICGNGGHGLTRLTRKNGPPLRTPQQLQITGHADKVILENYDDQDYGYLRVVVTQKQLRIEYHPASDGDGAKTPDDFVTVDLAARKLVHFTGA
ncbi:metallophosphoesterase [Bradyrhizobium sp. CCGUVB23]|uniref:metallophosphoesterase n=1 Tax=Bradyrhizobium sp. CCGUVB23 TaxID=2949630 RepID=UPI0020B2D4E2|nr:metallophosphoesterase [Bradyrhizobium sp. CCGUVB23]MCP3463120.1 metallophosphoesterase [Bradyrhizobium sp. CCGUVB23]